MMHAAEVYGTGFSQGLRPESQLTVSEWADKYRLLSQRASAEAGRWRTARTPYLREIMDALSSSSPYERVVFMKGAQIGGTECGNNFVGYVIHHAPGPIMSIQPTVEMAKRNSKQRIDPLIEESPVLRNLVQSPRSRDSGNTILSKEFPGGILVMTGANSAVGLRSMAGAVPVSGRGRCVPARCRWRRRSHCARHGKSENLCAPQDLSVLDAAQFRNEPN
jgi:phage terminase large subunit GpA-like protein